MPFGSEGFRFEGEDCHRCLSFDSSSLHAESISDSSLQAETISDSSLQVETISSSRYPMQLSLYLITSEKRTDLFFVMFMMGRESRFQIVPQEEASGDA